MYLTRHSGISMTAWQKAIEQLLLLCLSINPNGASEYGAIPKSCPFWSPRNDNHCWMSCHRINVMNLRRRSENLGSAWWMPVDQLSRLSLSNLANAAPTLENCQVSLFRHPSNHIQCKLFCDRIIVMHLRRRSEILGSTWWMPVDQLSTLSLSNLANAAPTLENCQVSLFIHPSNHIHCKLFCDRIIVMHLRRRSDILGSAWWIPVDQLSRLSLSNLANGAPTLENCQVSLFIHPSNHIHCKLFCDRIIVMHLRWRSEILGSAWLLGTTFSLHCDKVLRSDWHYYCSAESFQCI
jgi:peptide deformylase